jgi:hypothetical protein
MYSKLSKQFVLSLVTLKPYSFSVTSLDSVDYHP